MQLLYLDFPQNSLLRFLTLFLTLPTTASHIGHREHFSQSYFPFYLLISITHPQRNELISKEQLE